MKFKLIQKQVEIADRIVDALEDENYDNVLLISPTGSGKSGIARNIQLQLKKRNYPESSVNVMMHQKSLQDQYEKLFVDDDNSVMIKGKDNYTCGIFGDTKVSEAPCQLGHKCLSECEYMDKRKKVSLIPFVISNYQLVFSLIDLNAFDFPKYVSVYDEGHNLENVFTDFRICSISNLDIANYKNFAENCHKYGDIPKHYENGAKNIIEILLITK